MELEARALRSLVNLLLRSPGARQRHVAILDFRVVFYSLSKGRSNSRRLNFIIRTAALFEIGAGIDIAVSWGPTWANVADDPSLNVMLRQSKAAPIWFQDFCRGDFSSFDELDLDTVRKFVCGPARERAKRLRKKKPEGWRELLEKLSHDSMQFAGSLFENGNTQIAPVGPCPCCNTRVLVPSDVRPVSVCPSCGSRVELRSPGCYHRMIQCAGPHGGFFYGCSMYFSSRCRGYRRPDGSGYPRTEIRPGHIVNYGAEHIVNPPDSCNVPYSREDVTSPPPSRFFSHGHSGSPSRIDPAGTVPLPGGVHCRSIGTQTSFDIDPPGERCSRGKYRPLSLYTVGAVYGVFCSSVCFLYIDVSHTMPFFSRFSLVEPISKGILGTSQTVFPQFFQIAVSAVSPLIIGRSVSVHFSVGQRIAIYRPTMPSPNGYRSFSIVVVARVKRSN